MMIEHYVEFSARPFADDLHFIINKLFNRLHGIISKEKLNLGLAFPRMTSRSPGNSIRIFGKLEELKATRENPGIQNLSNRGFIDMSGIERVPTNAEPVVYVRIRSPEKLTATGVDRKIKRLKRRAMERGEDWVSNIHDRVFQKLKKKENRISEIPYVLIERGGNSIPIFFKRIPIMGIKPNSNPKFNDYGFGNDSNGSVNAVYDF